MQRVSVIVSTYNKPHLLRRCLLAIERHARESTRPLKHIWHEDKGFRKTEILNKAVVAAEAEYLIFIDGDCITHPDFIGEHVREARAGHYLNGSLIRLSRDLSDRITETAIRSGQAFRPGWLMRQGGHFNRRYLRLSLPHSWRQKLNRHTPTKLYWLGSNSSCFKSDAVALNGFDHRFTYGFEDADFGYRLELAGVAASTVRWTAVVLHLWHERPYSSPERIAANRKLADEPLASGRTRAIIGIDELSAPPDSPGSAG